MAQMAELSDDHLPESELDDEFEYYSLSIDSMLQDADDFDVSGAGFSTDGTSESTPLALPDRVRTKRSVRSVTRTYEEDVRIVPGRRSVWHVPHPKLFEEATDRAFYLLYFPIDVYPFTNDKRYRRIEFGIQLDGESDVDALDLCPQDVYGTETVSRTYTLEPSLKFTEVGGSLGNAEWKRTFSRLHPMVTTFGPGKSKFGWVFSAGADDQILPGARHNWVLLNAPADCETLEGTFYSDAVYLEKSYGFYRKKPVVADERSFSIDLDDSETLSERWWNTASD